MHEPKIVWTIISYLSVEDIFYGSASFSLRVLYEAEEGGQGWRCRYRKEMVRLFNNKNDV